MLMRLVWVACTEGTRQRQFGGFLRDLPALLNISARACLSLPSQVLGQSTGGTGAVQVRYGGSVGAV